VCFKKKRRDFFSTQALFGRFLKFRKKSSFFFLKISVLTVSYKNNTECKRDGHNNIFTFDLPSPKYLEKITIPVVFLIHTYKL